MQIFHNANYDFIRWRWHALILSSVIIIGGFVLSLARGGVPRSEGKAVRVVDRRRLT